MKLHSEDAKEARLAKLPLFQEASRKALKHLAAAADDIEVAEGSEMLRQGAIHHETFIIVSGSATVSIDGTDVATIPAGEMVGELSFFNRGPSTATVTAAEPVALLSIPHNRFQQILDDHPALTQSILIELASRLRQMDAEYSKWVTESS